MQNGHHPPRRSHDAAVAGHIIGGNAPTISPVAREDGFAAKLDVPVILAESDGRIVRCRVARNPRAPVEILVRLAEDAEAEVRRSALASLHKTAGAE